jgi:hypothetical protein
MTIGRNESKDMEKSTHDEYTSQWEQEIGQRWFVTRVPPMCVSRRHVFMRSISIEVVVQNIRAHEHFHDRPSMAIVALIVVLPRTRTRHRFRSTRPGLTLVSHESNNNEENRTQCV